jgi:2-aminobenzoate-CoA ligase
MKIAPREPGGALPDYPARINAAAELVDRWAETAPGRIAIRFGETVFTYGDLAGEVNRFANGFRGLGLERGQCVVLSLANRPEAAFALLAAMRMGAIPVPTFHFLKTPELQYLIGVTDAAGLVAGDAQRAALADCPTLRFAVSAAECRGADAFQPAANTGRDDIGTLCFTSGTTGDPKGLPYRHRAILGVADLAVPEGSAEMGDGDVVFTTTPFGFSFSVSAMIYFPFRFGAAALYADGRPEPEDVLRTLEANRVTHFFTVPTLCQQLLDVPDAATRFDLSGLRALKVGGMPTPVALQERFMEVFGIPILPGFGMAEASGAALTCYPENYRFGTIGLPQPHCQARILGEDGCELPVGEAGRLSVRAPYLIREYWRDPEKTKAAIDEDGWLLTDDLARMEEDGFYVHLGRADEVIISAGWTLSPDEIEEAMRAYPGVAEAAVIGLGDADKGQIPVAAVVRSPGAPAEAVFTAGIKAFLTARLAPYKCPRRIIYLDALPKTPAGKTARGGLRDLLATQKEEN